MIIINSSTEIMAYMSRVARSFRHKQRLLPEINMALDSRELRFYASSLSSSSPIARSSVRNKQKQNTDVFGPMATPIDVRLSYFDEKVPAAVANQKLLESGNPASFSIYYNGIAGLMNSFDSEMKRAFAHPAASIHTARFSSFATFTSQFTNLPEDSFGTKVSADLNSRRPTPAGKDANSIEIDLNEQEQELFDLLRSVTKECGMKSTLRVAGGWVRDKILATKEFKQNRVSSDLFCDGNNGPNGENEAMNRITSKFKGERSSKFFACL